MHDHAAFILMCRPFKRYINYTGNGFHRYCCAYLSFMLSHFLLKSVGLSVALGLSSIDGDIASLANNSPLPYKDYVYAYVDKNTHTDKFSFHTQL